MAILNMIYGGNKLIKTPWIYHNSNLWLISLSSNWTDWITIADKNLWATTIYNNGDTMDEANCWKYYQRWNNYWFPFNWPTTTSTAQIDASNYWPLNYYSSSTFIIAWWWDTSNNKNLRWGETWTIWAMQWPCDNWFHIPTKDEFNTLYNIWIALWSWDSSSSTDLSSYLKLPLSWCILNAGSTWSKYEVWSRAYYWSAIGREIGNWQSYILYATETSINAAELWGRWTWIMVRPFRNAAIQPDSSRTKLY